MANIDFQNMFANDSASSIDKLVTIIRSIRDLINNETTVKDLDYGYSKEIANTLDNIIPDKQCADVQITTNLDNTLFGIYVNPTISNVDLMDILVGDEATPINRYRVEIDSKIFQLLDPAEIAAYMLYNIEATTGEAAIRFVQFYIDKFMASREDNIDIKNSINYSNILIFGIKDAIARFADLLSGVGPVESPYLVGIREKVNKRVSGLADATRVSNLGILDWCLLVYTELKTEWRDAVDRINTAKALTGSRLRKEEMEKLVMFLQRASRETVAEATEMAVREQVLVEGKGFSLFRRLKQNGLRSIEEDLYEYKVRTKNCSEQADAIYILRCINTRMSILEDYLMTTPELTPTERERWEGLLEQYRELRAIVSAKKFGSASKNFNSFLNIDYDALDKLDRQQEATEVSLKESIIGNATIGFQIRPRQDLPTSCKKGSYPGLLNYASNCKSLSKLNYLKKDLSTTNYTLKKILERVKLVEDGKGDPKWEKGIQKKYIDNGVTSKNLEKYINWLNTTYKKAINDRIAELKKLNEAAGIFMEADEDTEENKAEAEAPTEDEGTDEGFEAADDNADTSDVTMDDASGEENTSGDVDQSQDQRQNLAGSDLKSDGGDIYVNCTINKSDK